MKILPPTSTLKTAAVTGIVGGLAFGLFVVAMKKLGSGTSPVAKPAKVVADIATAR